VRGHERTVMGLFKKDEDTDEGAGSGDGGTLGTPSTDVVEDPAGGTQEGMVVSGGGVADPGEDDATAEGERGLG
jgi:hypothetical protein